MAGEFDHLVLSKDEFLLLRPKTGMSLSQLQEIAALIPAEMRGRVIVVEPDSFEMMVVRKVGSD